MSNELCGTNCGTPSGSCAHFSISEEPVASVCPEDVSGSYVAVQQWPTCGLRPAFGSPKFSAPSPKIFEDIHLTIPSSE